MAYTTINKSSDYFNTKLYTGNSSTQNITGLDFQPDWVSIKDRDATNSFMTFDAVRGATELINWNTTNAESTQTPTLTSFNSDGFSIGNNTALNTNGNNLVAWNWKANGAGSANTDGSISSTVSANTTSGFSIVSFTGTGANATVGHGLGVAPKFMIFKNRNGGFNWNTYHSAYSPAQSQEFNSTNAAENTGSAMWNSTATTSSVFSLGTTGSVNQSSAPIIAYCFAEKTGYSKFGSYVGNGNADGTFVYTGFKPAFVIIKKDGTGNWQLFDNKRVGYNQDNHVLRPNLNNVECTSCVEIDILSNGFKLRNTDGDGNTGSGDYIYMSIGQSLVGSNNVPCTAR